MSKGCCCCKKKVAPIPVVVTREEIAPIDIPKEKPNGYARLYAGVKTSENNYSSPVISLHTYNKARNVIMRQRTTLDVTTAGYNQSNENIFHSGPSSSNKTDKQATEEKVRCIPVEDIISVSYSTDVKIERETLETKQERARATKGKLGCCAATKQCLRETFCRCPKCPCKVCKPPPEEKPQYDTNTRQNTTAKRMILIEMKFDNNENDEYNFKAKRDEAEKLCRIIVQLRNMTNNYPSPTELNEILKQEQAALFGDEIDY